MKINLGNGIIIDAEQQLLELDRADYEDSLYLFLKNGWKHIDPAPWRDGWPIEAVAEHLQAVIDGDIKRLIINIPPRMGKSSICSVALPAWCWAQPERRWGSTCGPGTQFLYASYAQQLSVRDSVKCRRLIQSPWYQQHWGKRFKLASDQNVKGRFLNDHGGERLITSVGSAATGEGGSVIVCDDPNAADEAFSEATIEATIDWWDGTMSTRLNDAKTGAYVVVQQRLAEDDLTGHILSKDKGEWTHLILPMHYDPERSFVTAIGWKDPRTETGELLWPERFGEPEVAALERSLVTRAAGQLEQAPVTPGGGIIKRAWWKLWDEGAFPPMDFIMASLDTAYTEDTMNDPSAMTVWGVFTQDSVATASRTIDRDGRPVYLDRVYAETAPKLMLMGAWSEHMEFHDLVTKVAETAKRFRVDKILIENKASGISVAQELRRIYANENFGVQLNDPKSTDKVSRLFSVQHIFNDGTVYAPDRKWSDEVISEVAIFPKGKHDDRVDTVSQALRHMRDMGLLVRAQERLEEIEGMKQYAGRAAPPLYPG